MIITGFENIFATRILVFRVRYNPLPNYKKINVRGTSVILDAEKKPILIQNWKPQTHLYNKRCRNGERLKVVETCIWNLIPIRKIDKLTRFHISIVLLNYDGDFKFYVTEIKKNGQQ